MSKLDYTLRGLVAGFGLGFGYTALLYMGYNLWAISTICICGLLGILTTALAWKEGGKDG